MKLRYHVLIRARVRAAGSETAISENTDPEKINKWNAVDDVVTYVGFCDRAVCSRNVHVTRTARYPFLPLQTVTHTHTRVLALYCFSYLPIYRNIHVYMYIYTRFNGVANSIPSRPVSERVCVNTWARVCVTWACGVHDVFIDRSSLFKTIVTTIFTVQQQKATDEAS